MLLPDLNNFFLLASCAVVNSFALAGPKESGGPVVGKIQSAAVLVPVGVLLGDLSWLSVALAGSVLYLTVDTLE